MYTQHQATAENLLDLLNRPLKVKFPAAGLPLGGLTLIVDEDPDPDTTITFPGSAGALVTAIDAAATIAAADATGLHVKSRGYGTNGDRQLLITAETSLTFLQTGTANALFGLATDASTTIAPVASEDIVLFTNTSNSSDYILILKTPDP